MPDSINISWSIGPEAYTYGNTVPEPHFLPKYFLDICNIAMNIFDFVCLVVLFFEDTYDPSLSLSLTAVSRMLQPFGSTSELFGSQNPKKPYGSLVAQACRVYGFYRTLAVWLGGTPLAPPQLGIMIVHGVALNTRFHGLHGA